MVDEERLKFVRLWADYVRTHEDREWSRQQNKLIDSQIKSVREFYRKNPDIRERVLKKYRLKDLKKSE